MPETTTPITLDGPGGVPHINEPETGYITRGLTTYAVDYADMRVGAAHALGIFEIASAWHSPDGVRLRVWSARIDNGPLAYGATKHAAISAALAAQHRRERPVQSPVWSNTWLRAGFLIGVDLARGADKTVVVVNERSKDHERKALRALAMRHHQDFARVAGTTVHKASLEMISSWMVATDRAKELPGLIFEIEMAEQPATEEKAPEPPKGMDDRFAILAWGPDWKHDPRFAVRVLGDFLSPKGRSLSKDPARVIRVRGVVPRDQSSKTEFLGVHAIDSKKGAKEMPPRLLECLAWFKEATVEGGNDDLVAGLIEAWAHTHRNGTIVVLGAPTRLTRIFGDALPKCEAYEPAGGTRFEGMVRGTGAHVDGISTQGHVEHLAGYCSRPDDHLWVVLGKLPEAHRQAIEPSLATNRASVIAFEEPHAASVSPIGGFPSLLLWRMSSLGRALIDAENVGETGHPVPIFTPSEMEKKTLRAMAERYPEEVTKQYGQPGPVPLRIVGAWLYGNKARWEEYCVALNELRRARDAQRPRRIRVVGTTLLGGAQPSNPNEARAHKILTALKGNTKVVTAAGNDDLYAALAVGWAEQHPTGRVIVAAKRKALARIFDPSPNGGALAATGRCEVVNYDSMGFTNYEARMISQHGSSYGTPPRIFGFRLRDSTTGAHIAGVKSDLWIITRPITPEQLTALIDHTARGARVVLFGPQAPEVDISLDPAAWIVLR